MIRPVGTTRAVARAALALLAAAALSSGAGPASAAPGGIGSAAPENVNATGGDRARLMDGRALPPLAAPAPVARAIRAANRIASKPYVWGGGHGRWWDRGYDCSGAVSYALHGAGLLGRAMDSGGLMRWGAPGPGRWITVYANAGHAYALIAGLRWDTAGGPGPRWHRRQAVASGFTARHPIGF